MSDIITRIGEKERAYVEEVLSNNFRSSAGYKMTKRLEDAFAAKFGVNYAVAFCNGTATLHAALEVLGVRKGDEVIVPPLTMSSTTFCVLQANATPVFADVDPDTFQISAKSIEERITPRTKAIVPVSLYGLCPDFDAIKAIAKKHNLAILEDDAQCFLGMYKGQTVGSIGDIASFSFQGSKHITCGEGGMLITNSEELADKIRKYSCLGYASVGTKSGKIAKNDIQAPDYNRHLHMGWNYRMSDVCSAVALGQVERLDELVNVRIESAKIFNDAIAGNKILIPQKVGAEYVNSYWCYAAKLVDDSIGWRTFRDKYLELGGDGVYGAWKLTYQEPMFKTMNFLGREEFLTPGISYQDGICPNAEYLQPRLMQFKTNYYNLEVAKVKAEALAKTIAYFE